MSFRKAFLILTTALLLPLSGCVKADEEYGVFIGLDQPDAEKTSGYKTVVIEPSVYTSSDIEAMHEEEQTVWGYLDVGSLEEYSSYFEEFRDDALGEYDGWDGEYWADVTDEEFTEFLTEDLADEYAKLGLDGFFLDNFDVYDMYETDEVYESLCDVLSRLRQYDLTIVVNGGDVFMTRLLSDKNQSDGTLPDAVNQECVFTTCESDGTYGTQSDETEQYFKEYLATVKETGIDVYLTEYRADTELSDEISQYCGDNGFAWYNAESRNLD